MFRGATLSVSSDAISSASTALAATGSARAPVPTPPPPEPAAPSSDAALGLTILPAAADAGRWREPEDAKRVAQMNHDFKLRNELLGTAVPNKYLELVAGLRSATRAFNASLVEIPEQPLPHLKWYESPNIALRDPVYRPTACACASRV